MALGGAAAGFIVIRLLDRGGMSRNPGGMRLDIDGSVVYARVGGMPAGVYGLYIERPRSTAEDFIGTVEQSVGGILRAFPPQKYDKLGVGSTMPTFAIEDGIPKRTLHSAARYLVEAYMDHYPMSKAAQIVRKREIGEEFSRMLGAQ